MQENKLQKLYGELCFTSVFIGVMQTPLFQAFSAYITATESYQKKAAYAAFVSCVYEGGGNLSACVQKAVFEDENAYIKAVAHGDKTPACIKSSVKRELAAFSAFAVT